MRFRVKIVVHRALNAPTARGLPEFFLEGVYVSADAARAAAEAVICQEGYKPGEASSVIFGPDDEEVEAEPNADGQ